MHKYGNALQSTRREIVDGICDTGPTHGESLPSLHKLTSALDLRGLVPDGERDVAVMVGYTAGIDNIRRVVQVYDPRVGCWEIVGTALVSCKQKVEIHRVQNKMCVIVHAYDDGTPNKQTRKSVLAVSDQASMSWTYYERIYIPRAIGGLFTSVVVDNRLYVISGRGLVETDGVSFFSLSPENGDLSLERASTISIPSRVLSACVIGSSIYVCGGSGSAAVDAKDARVIEYDVETKSIKVHRPPYGRTHLQLCSADSTLYLFGLGVGGIATVAQKNTAVGSQGEWREIAQLPITCPREFQVCNLMGYIRVFGSSGMSLCKSYIYDGSEKAWTTTNPMLTPINSNGMDHITASTCRAI